MLPVGIRRHELRDQTRERLNMQNHDIVSRIAHHKSLYNPSTPYKSIAGTGLRARVSMKDPDNTRVHNKAKIGGI